MSAARTVCRHEKDPEVRLEILCAAVAPSDRVYYIAGEPGLEAVA